jgi:3-hydroxyisobutyrate dehydrogenase
MSQIGFVGLGHMGLPMAKNLIKSGHKVVGFDLQSAAMDALVEAGGIAAKDLKAVAIDSDVVITMLQTGEQVRSIALGPSGLLMAMKKKSLYIDCSTIDVASARLVHQQAEYYHVLMIDAPVSGGVAGAIGGTLTFMVGGERDAFAIAEPILSLMGKKIIYAGMAGSGQAAKICNNMILGISMIAVSEAFILAETLGLTPQKLFEVVTHASGQCWVINNYVPVPGVLESVPANRDYQPGFTVAMMLKDLCLSQKVAEESGVVLSMAERATGMYQQFSDAGNANLDFSAIIRLLAQTIH